MKKFFLLTYLLISISPSYAMDLQIEDGDIVFYNPQGQKTRKVLFDPMDPAADLKLNPTKGEVLWFEREKEIRIPGYPKPFKVDGEIEITLSPIAYFGDYLKVQLGLHAFNLENTEDFEEWGLNITLPLNETHCIAGRFQESLNLEFDPLLPLLGVDKAFALLKDVEADAYGRGARRAYVTVLNEDTREPWTASLKAHQYQESGAIHTLHKEGYFQRFYKELSPVEYQEDVLTKWNCQWEYDQNEPKDFSDYFGVFVRQTGEVKGGVLGKIHTNAYIPHSTIGFLWVDESLRGLRLGTKLMQAALKHSKEQGASMAQLDTIDFQAPVFYEKLGFKKVFTDPDILKTRDGKLNSSYVYRKTL